MKVKYVGPHTEGVEISVANFAATVEHGESIEVSDGLGRSLLEQPDNWQPAQPVKATKADAPQEDDK